MKIYFTLSLLILTFILHAQTDCVTVTAEVSSTSCLGYDDGSIDITVIGGTPPYTFLWNNGATTEDLTNIDIGGYAVKVTDSTGCVTFYPDQFILDSLGAIPDGVGVSYQFPLIFDNSPADAVISNEDVISFCIIIEHSWLRDLEIKIQSPDSTTIILHDHPVNFGGENYLGIPIDGDAPPIPGIGWEYCWTMTSENGTWLEYINSTVEHTLPADNYTPFESFENLIAHSVNGEWTLIITDLWGGDNGFVFDWSVKINNQHAHAQSNDRIDVLGSPINCHDIGISGNVFYDFNENQIQDEYEIGLSNLSVSFEPTGVMMFPDQDGHYLELCDSGTVYTVSLIENPDWALTTDAASYTILYEPYNEANLNNDFGVVPTFQEHEANINLSASNILCFQYSDFYLRFQNTGTYLEEGQIKLHYDSTSTYSLSIPTADIIDEENHILTWNYDSLYPFQYEDIYIQLLMPGVDSIGEILHFLTEIYSDSLGESLLLAEYDYSFPALCSFDPNDKQVNPPGVREENYTLHDEKLTYTIRFQNTGNAPAIDIRILDTLDTNLDINTFRVVNSSFPVFTSLQGNAVEFYFKDIWLIDSLANEAESHGFVTYEISPIEGLEDYAEIQNTAHIIFDFNPAIVTNTTYNTMVTEIPTGVREIETTPIFIHPNPTSSHFYISTTNNEAIDNVLIYNSLGQLILQTKEMKIDVSSFATGIYIVQVEIAGKIGMGKLVVE